MMDRNMYFLREDGGSNSSVFLFAGIAAELALLTDLLCIIIATGGLEYGFDPLGAGCIIGAGCILLILLCGVLLGRGEQMVPFIASAVATAAVAAAMLVFRMNVLDFCQQALSSVRALNTDFASVVPTDK